MKAVVYQEFKGPMAVKSVTDPLPAPTGVVLAVKACGICRRDWPGWLGNDPDIKLPHAPGHELSGVAVIDSF